MPTTIHRSNDNIFRDVGFPPNVAENLRLRSALMIEVRRTMMARKLTQAAAAKLFGVSQPRISDLVRGRIELFSIDGLVIMLGHAGISVQFTTRRGAVGPGGCHPERSPRSGRSRRISEVGSV